MVVCCVCGKAIAGKYFIDSWGNASHMEHGGIPAERCSSCGRFLTGNSLKLPDKRTVCGDCRERVIVENKQLPVIEKRVRERLMRVGIDDIPELASIELVDGYTLGDLLGCGWRPMLRGLTRTEVRTSLFHTSVSHRVYLLNYLTPLECEGTLAHEILHAWQNEHKIKLSAPVTEGFCNLGSYQVYLSRVSKLADFLVKQMKQNPDPAYGEGFRHMLALQREIGWEALIKRMRSNQVYFN